MEYELRTELVGLRVTPSEKLRLIKAARNQKYRGSISNLLRDLLAGTVNDKAAPYPGKSEKSDFVSATN